MTFLLSKNSLPSSDEPSIQQLKESLLGDLTDATTGDQAFRIEELKAFAKQPLVHRKMEHWKYNDTYFLTEKEYKISRAKEIDDALIERVRKDIDQKFANKQLQIITLIDGHWIESLSSISADKSLSIVPFSQANEAQASFIQSQVSKNKQSKNSFIQLNNCIASDGLLIEIAERQNIELPIVILHYKNQSQSNSLSATQILVKLGSHSQLQLAEYGFSIASQPADKLKDFQQLGLAQTQIILAASSQCDYYRLQTENSQAAQISRCLIHLEKDALLKAFFYAEGSRINKLDLDVIHAGEHSESHLAGVYLPRFEQNVDFHTTLEHRVANCQSREVFRGILADSSTATFNGKIHIFQDAQKTDAQLNNKNLLLTNQATINTKPELEIYADDVVCAHGATVAKIDPEAIYYLQSRGIGTTRAKKMLSIGFIQELIDQMPESSIRQDITERAQTCLSEIQSL